MDGDRIYMGKNTAQHVQAYIDYHNIVGNDDNGQPFTEQEFEQYKQKVKHSRLNRLYASYRNPKGLDCKNIGPSSKCFCGHRYKDHAFDNVDTREVHCKTRGCLCPLFQYIPVHGSADFKCVCKHSCTEHDPITKRCKVGRCACPQKFTSSYSCNCGTKHMAHKTVFESREQRQALGKPVDSGGPNMNAGMGGISNYQSLLDGVDRMGLEDQGQDRAGPKQKSLKPKVSSKTDSGLGPNVEELERNYQEQQEQTKKKSSIRQPPADFFDKPENRHLVKGGNHYAEEGYDYMTHGPSAEKENSAYQLFNTPHIFGAVTITYNHSSSGASGGMGHAAIGYDMEAGTSATGFRSSGGMTSSTSAGAGSKKPISRAQQGIERAKEMARKKQAARERQSRLKQERDFNNMNDDLQY
mmetsp:Transcript_13450/g.14911  ORF Transcript_13450/g.14911 Transcript_13450/m.14911 type:complete len:411 (-) Transcript_13450:6-1238(-)